MTATAPQAQTSHQEDADTRRRREVLGKMRHASDDELFAVAVRAGIFEDSGELASAYVDVSTMRSATPRPSSNQNG